jgi:glycerophosphoryl diester phosphodiesterase
LKNKTTKQFTAYGIVFSLVLVAYFLGVSACKKLENFPDSPIENNGKTLLIMHRGGGFSGAGRNTLDGAIHGMTVANGIEIDVQMSQDNTPWVEHESRIEECGGKDKTCFINLSDQEIEERIGCGDFYSVRLEAILQEASKNFPNSIIVVDCKAWSPCGLSELNSIRSMKKMGSEIINLAKKYNLEENIIIDSNVKPLLRVIDRGSSMKIYYRSFASLDKAVRNAFDVHADGLSLDQNRFNLSKDDIELVNQKGLEVQLWTINDEQQLNDVLELNPQQVLTEVIPE